MYVYTYCTVYVGQDEVEDAGLTTDEPIENDSIAFYFCSPKVTANCKCIMYCVWLNVHVRTYGTYVLYV